MTRPRRSWGTRLLSGLTVFGWEAAAVGVSVAIAFVIALVALALV
ncbi:MAG: hypothetical protein QY307_05070 [Acidimicrobiia bacterium]|nr:MAG: hypothetical protein QY307_05070 [Acidimicrobiia bacterium]